MMDEAEQRQFDAMNKKLEELNDEIENLYLEKVLLKEMLEEYQSLCVDYQKLMKI